MPSDSNNCLTQDVTVVDVSETPFGETIETRILHLRSCRSCQCGNAGFDWVAEGCDNIPDDAIVWLATMKLRGEYYDPNE